MLAHHYAPLPVGAEILDPVHQVVRDQPVPEPAAENLGVHSIECPLDIKGHKGQDLPCPLGLEDLLNQNIQRLFTGALLSSSKMVLWQ